MIVVFPFISAFPAIWANICPSFASTAFTASRYGVLPQLLACPAVSGSLKCTNV